jgi:hypothetical protein
MMNQDRSLQKKFFLKRSYDYDRPIGRQPYLIEDNVIAPGVRVNLFDLSQYDNPNYDTENLDTWVSEGAAVESILVEVIQASSPAIVEKFTVPMPMAAGPYDASRFTAPDNQQDSSVRIAKVMNFPVLLMPGIMPSKFQSNGSPSVIFEDTDESTSIHLSISFHGDLDLKTGHVSGYPEVSSWECSKNRTETKSIISVKAIGWTIAAYYLPPTSSTAFHGLLQRNNKNTLGQDVEVIKTPDTPKESLENSVHQNDLALSASHRRTQISEVIEHVMGPVEFMGSTTTDQYTEAQYLSPESLKGADTYRRKEVFGFTIKALKSGSPYMKWGYVDTYDTFTIRGDRIVRDCCKNRVLLKYIWISSNDGLKIMEEGSFISMKEAYEHLAKKLMSPECQDIVEHALYKIQD